MKTLENIAIDLLRNNNVDFNESNIENQLFEIADNYKKIGTIYNDDINTNIFGWSEIFRVNENFFIVRFSGEFDYSDFAVIIKGNDNALKFATDKLYELTNF